MLNPIGLKSEFQKMGDPLSSLFEGFPSTFEESIERLGYCFTVYCQDVIPISTSVSIAITAFKNRLLQLSLNMMNGRTVFPDALNILLTTLGSGMLNTNIVVVTPIFFTEVDFDPLWNLGFSGGSADACLSLFVSIVHNKFLISNCENKDGVIIYWT